MIHPHSERMFVRSKTVRIVMGSSITVSTNWVISASNIFEPVLRQGHSDRDKEAFSFRASQAPRASGEGAHLEDCQSVFRAVWRVHRSWSLAIPAEFGTPVSHEIVLSVAVSAWLQNVPELPLLSPLSFHCPLSPAEARQLRWCVVKNDRRPNQRTQNAQDDRTLRNSTYFLNVLGSVNWSIPWNPHSFLCRMKAHHQLQLPPRCNGKSRGVHSVLRSGVEQRSFAHTISLLGA